MKKVLIINGPNLNLLGERDPLQYGSKSLSEIQSETEITAKNLGLSVEWFQSNHEGEIVEKLQQIRTMEYFGLVINPGGYAHSSVAILDALLLVNFLKVEVHLSPLFKREEFRQQKITAQGCDCLLEGLGPDCYSVALFALMIKKR